MSWWIKFGCKLTGWNAIDAGFLIKTETYERRSEAM